MSSRLMTALLAVAVVIGGCGGVSPRSPQASGASQPATTKAPSWNLQDANAATNGNLTVAVRLLKDMSQKDVESKAETAAPADVMKAPWKQYGHILRFTGLVGIVQEYPPGSEISRGLGGGEVGEIVLVTEDQSFIDFLQIGSTGDIHVGDMATVYGYPVGLVDVQNKLGGTTTQVLCVGKVAIKGAR